MATEGIAVKVQILDGTPAEIAEFLRLTEGESGKGDADAPEVLVSGSHMESRAEVAVFVEERGRSADTNTRVLDYVEKVRGLGVEIVAGTSARTKDGLTDYLMIRDSGVRRFGAVAYVKPANGGLTLRLTENDVADIDLARIKLRDVRPGHKYVVNCPLRDDAAVQFAVDLTMRALDKVRGGDA
ncbi:hypothetical protein [Streptomyces sp. NPDC057748]|uniref:hypothetical protein n=1 Tax=unclassified Streptomyces TaxID=2593676 RepID=UPI0036973655